jgi:LPS-assembly protein
MLKVGAWVMSPLLFLQIHAQEAGVLPVEPAAPSVDLIAPVPAPEIPLTSAVDGFSTMPESLKLSNYGGGPYEFVRGGELVIYHGPGIKVTGDNGLEIHADRAVLDLKAAKVTLEGNVRIYQGNVLQRGTRVVYFYDRKFLDIAGLRGSADQLLLESGKFVMEERDGGTVFVGENAGVTTHDVEEPNYWVRAKQIKIYPGEKIVFNNLRLFAGETPVFWLPYLSQPLDAELGYHFVPGARTNWGPYLLNTYGIMLGGKRNEKTGENEDAWLLSRWRLDLLTTRGIGTGVDLVDTRVDHQDSFTGLGIYYINDLAPDTRRSGVPRGFVNEDRYRIDFKHRLPLEFEDEGEWRIDTQLTHLSDLHYLEDFAPDQYRRDPAPDNTIGLYRRDEDSLLSLQTRLRINDFYRTDTRLPEISYDQVRAPIFGLPLLHEGGTSFGIIGEKTADTTRDTIIDPLLQMESGDPAAQPLLRQLTGFERRLAEQILRLPLNDPRREAIRTQLVDSSYTRLHTYQELSLPLTFGGFLNVIPQAGAGYTHYGSVEGPVGSSDLTHLHAGAEASVKFSKDLGGGHDSRWGLEGLKHVIQPYSLWSVVSTDDFDPYGPLVDRLTPTTRPRPLDPVRFTALDEMQSWNVVRIGARNRLLTQRDRQSFEWLFVDTYVDAFINDPEGEREFSNLYNDLSWKPLPWMAVDLSTQLPMVSGGSGFSEIDSRFRFMPNDRWEFSLGYRMLEGHPVFTDSNRVDFQYFTRLNENWGLGTRHVLELDDGTLEVEQYTLHRDMGNWVAGVGFTHRDNRLEEEYGVVFSLMLKDFPSVSLPFSIDAE